MSHDADNCIDWACVDPACVPVEPEQRIADLEKERDALRAENERLQVSASAADHVIGTLHGDLGRMREGNRGRQGGGS